MNSYESQEEHDYKMNIEAQASHDSYCNQLTDLQSQLQAETERRWKAECLLGEAIALLKLRDANPDLITFKDYEAYKQKYQDKP